MKLKNLLHKIPGMQLKNFKDVEVTALCNNSKAAAPGSLFFAKKGINKQGHTFIREAITAGSIVIVTDLFDPFLPESIVQIIHQDVALLEAILAKKFYEDPRKKLWTIGITGTNGKTTCSYLIKHLLDCWQKPAGLIGTIEWVIKDSIFPSLYTTPDILTNRRLFKEMVTAGCQAVVMEVSSHGLDQGRVEGIDFDVAVFTNLTQDHLDYHLTMQEYAKAKAKLFSSLKKPGSCGVINLDSPYAFLMQEKVSTRCITYGIYKEADLMAKEISFSAKETSCVISYQGENAVFRSSLVGLFNVYNALAAIATALALGGNLTEIIKWLSSFHSVPGRLERVENKAGKHVFVDYAHTEDALKNALETLREISSGRLVCVFGCGGDRDRLKRPKMGAVASKLADLVFVTSDNPRNEEPAEIVQEVLSGIEDRKNIRVELDRKEAICQAIDCLQRDDVLLIAGKGHEKVQIFRHKTIHFDDRIIAKEYS